MSNLNQIKNIISNSGLSQEDQDQLLVFLSLAEDSELEAIVKLFSENPDSIEKISDNLKKKQAAVASNSVQDWNKILKEEEEELNKVQ